MRVKKVCPAAGGELGEMADPLKYNARGVPSPRGQVKD